MKAKRPQRPAIVVPSGALDRRAIAADLRALAARDPDFAAALEQVGPPPSRERPPGFASLMRIIVGQQVSAAAASGIWTRLGAALPVIEAPHVAALDVDALRACGFSRQKAAYALGLAAAVAEGRLRFDDIHGLEDEPAIAALTALKGIGRWTAEIYLLFSLRRRDIWPAGDLAVAVGVQKLKRLRQRPTPERLRRLAEPWRPYRSAAALFMWHYYSADRAPATKTAAEPGASGAAKPLSTKGLPV